MKEAGILVDEHPVLFIWEPPLGSNGEISEKKTGRAQTIGGKLSLVSAFGSLQNIFTARGQSLLMCLSALISVRSRVVTLKWTSLPPKELNCTVYRAT